MAAPKYLSELVYTFVHPPHVSRDIYQLESPESRFEWNIQRGLSEANAHLRNEEFGLALAAFQKLQAEILRVANPELPIEETNHPGFVVPRGESMVGPMLGLAAEILKATPALTHTIPRTLIPTTPIFAPAINTAIEGLTSTAPVVGVPKRSLLAVEQAMAVAASGDWKATEKFFETALTELGNANNEIRAVLTHDLAVAKEKNADRAGAIEAAGQAAELFKRVKDPNGQLQALLTSAGMNERAGNGDQANKLRVTAQELRLSQGLEPVVVGPVITRGGIGTFESSVLGHGINVGTIATGGTGISGVLNLPRNVLGGVSLDSQRDAVASRATEQLVLLSANLPASATTVKSIGIMSGTGAVKQVTLTQAGMTTFYTGLQRTTDLAELMDFVWAPTKIVAYLPHIYFFILPMAIGDCLAGLGDYEKAVASYESTLVYPFINKHVEAVRLWTRMADAYLEWGDSVYRRAGDDEAAQKEAEPIYRKIIRTNATLDNNSPLYKDASLAGVKTRAIAIAAALDDPTTLDENAQLITPIAEAHLRLQQIKAGLNYLSIASDYRPPFTFEYLQSLARGLAEQAQRAEQGYIQFKSQAENEELRADQLDQQVEVAAASVELERRSVAEAQAGIDVAEESLDYAGTKLDQAREARDDFSQARWDLLELQTLEAWAGASSVDRDDQVKLTITGYSSYEADGKRRNVVMKELAAQRTRITHDLEASRLAREVESASAYEDVAKAQRDQAFARKGVADQRQRIAEVQLRHSKENAEFLDLKEFSSRTWYEMARTTRRLVRRYLDMAIEVAYLMERAYELETGRDLARIRFDYAGPGTLELLASSRLAIDIDSFSHDFVTSTTTKKAPIKSTFSLAEHFPVAFASLRTTGGASFDTTLAHFERAYPGSYLGRIVNVEVQFVGLTNALGINGTLRNVGVSKFRNKAGGDESLVYPVDVLPLSQYEVRQDSLVFRFDEKQLRLFENCGLETGWFLDLPFDANDVDLSNLLDVRFVVYWDAFYDSKLEQVVRAALPAGGSATKSWSLSLMAPDELYFLQQNGTGALEMYASELPFSQTTTTRTRVRLALSGPEAAVRQRSIKLTTAAGASLAIQTNNSGMIDSRAGQSLNDLIGKGVPDTFTISVEGDTSEIVDVQAFVDYDFTYRTGA